MQILISGINNMDPLIQKMLRSLNLDSLSNAFIENEVDFKILQSMDNFDLAALVKGIGPRTQIKKFLKEYSADKEKLSDEEKQSNEKKPSNEEKQSNVVVQFNEVDELNEADEFNEVDQFNVEQESYNLPAANPPEVSSDVEVDRPNKISKNANRFFPRNQSLQALLQGCARGMTILESYGKQTKLNSDDRRHLVHLIIDAVLERHNSVSSAMFQELAEAITELFPSEAKGCYFSSGNSARKNSSGKLVDRYRNQKRYLQKNSKKNTPAPSNPSEFDEDIKESVQWLKHSSHPWLKVVELWTKTSAARLVETMNEGPLSEVVIKWPSLRHDLGYTLVSMSITSWT